MVAINGAFLERDLQFWIYLLIVFCGMVLALNMTEKNWKKILGEWLVGATVGTVLPIMFHWVLLHIGA